MAIYSEKEARNASLFKFVTENVSRQKDGLLADLAAMRREEQELLEAQRLALAQEAAAPSGADELAAPEGNGEGEGEVEGSGGEGGARGEGTPALSASRIAKQDLAWHAALEASLAIFDTMGMDIGITLPEHMQGKGCSLTTYPEFFSLLEQQMHDTFDSALHLASHPPPPEGEEGTEAEAEPRETLELLKSWTQPRHLFKGEAVLLKPRDEPVVVLDA